MSINESLLSTDVCQEKENMQDSKFHKQVTLAIRRRDARVHMRKLSMRKNNKLAQDEERDIVATADNSQNIGSESEAETDDKSTKVEDSSAESADDSTSYKPSAEYMAARLQMVEDAEEVKSTAELFPIKTRRELVKMRTRARESEAFREGLVRIELYEAASVMPCNLKRIGLQTKYFRVRSVGFDEVARLLEKILSEEVLLFLKHDTERKSCIVLQQLMCKKLKVSLQEYTFLILFLPQMCGLKKQN